MMMTASNHRTARISDHTLAAEGTREIVSSRFGELVIDMRNALSFPRGMLGMPMAQHFVLANFPSEKMQQFQLLQCLDDLTLSFITLPLAPENNILRREDIQTACHEFGIAEEHLALLLVVCVHRAADSTRLSVNARAPLLIDTEHKIGGQYVFTQDHYKVQHFIN